MGLATAADSRIIRDFDVSFALAGAMFEARRLREAIQLADELDASEDPDIRMSAAAFEMALLSARRLSDADREFALQAAERRIDRRLHRGEHAQAAATAYTLAMQHKRATDAPAAIDHDVHELALLEAVRRISSMTRWLDSGYSPSSIERR